ncbi:phosphotransferase [Streptantibioticus parmotrematis]|uniref:phosphotransferase n=1 Tax=Streptantibioticus parmotrematis TaxID=2873249 RepID=UPI0033C50F2B
MGSRPWVADVLAEHWDVPANSRPRPLRSDGTAPLSHTAALWRVAHRGRDHVFKVQLDREAARPPAFHHVKGRVLRACQDAGVPVPVPVPTTTGAGVAEYDGHLCELVPLAPGGASGRPAPDQADAVIATGLRLRRVLDGLPHRVVDDLAPLPVPPLVAEEDWRAALDDGVDRLLPLARARDDAWGGIARTALEGLERARPLLTGSSPDVATSPPGRRRVIHADLHHHHFLLDGAEEPHVVAVLDFDNMTVGDRLLDLAWIADTAARVRGGDAARARTAGRFERAALREGLLAPEELGLLMPLLVVHAVPVIVDIAKDILERDLLSPAWTGYLDLLDTRRRLALHRLLDPTAPASQGTDLPRTEDDR